jgi:pSer/pThr/pTyr-binding forkhead associated (FHA) protein
MSDEDNGNQTLFNVNALPTVRDVVLTFHGEEIVIDQAKTPFVIGRDATCDLQVDTAYASRKHCKILFHNKNFILKDSSTNGTYVRIGPSQPVQLNDSMTSLTGNGVIKLGQAITVGDKDVIEFKTRF